MFAKTECKAKPGSTQKASSVTTFVDEAGRLWIKLAKYDRNKVMTACCCSLLEVTRLPHLKWKLNKIKKVDYD